MAGRPPPPPNPLVTLPSRRNGEEAPVFDFTPFMEAPAVLERAGRQDGLQIVNIPETSIPSPLADNITPDILLRLKASLIGQGSNIGSNGHEVWLSWKRAWDLWNNHYIEGRVNPVWIAEVWEKKKNAVEEYDRMAKEEANLRTGSGQRSQFPGGKTRGPLRTRVPHKYRSRADVLAQRALSTSRIHRHPVVTVEDLAADSSKMSGSAHSYEDAAEMHPRMAAGAESRTLVPKSRSLVSEREVDKCQETIDANLSVELQGKIVEGETEGTFSEEYETEEETNESDYSPDTPGELSIEETESNVKPPRSSLKDLENPCSPKRVKLGDREDTAESQIMTEFMPMSAQSGQQTFPKKQNAFAQRSAPSDRSSPRKHFHSHAHIGQSTKNQEAIPTYNFNPPLSAAPPTATPNLIDLFHPDIRKVPSPKPRVIPLTSGAQTLSAVKKDGPKDGRSGGWIPIKNFPEYGMPLDPGLDDNDPVQVEWDQQIWDDIVENSVWRPRRVGEKTLKIDFDDEDTDDFYKNSELMVDGGVDCGREPFPVLRSLIEYTKTKEAVIRKKRVWDGVTGTIFNMPTKPLEADSDSEDPECRRIKNLYSDSFRDRRFANKSIFPLDIRRVYKRVEPPREQTRLLEKGEISIYDRTRPSEIKYRAMNKSDPWWVTDQQKLLRDNPLRRWPPRVEKDGKHLPTDELIWREEWNKDQNHEAMYFITNLSGGTLVVNGQQILKGAVAGPLPRFAVIESPGGQVSFWWGVYGRHFGVPQSVSDTGRKWQALRLQKEWKYVAMPSGQVWDQKIADRARRERRGDAEEDDVEWNLWKSTEKAEDNICAPNNGDGFERYRLGEEPRFTESDDSDIELKWATAQFLLGVDKPQNQVTDMIEPDENEFWKGSNRHIKPKPNFITQKTVDEIWASRSVAAQWAQNRFVRELATRKTKEDEAWQKRIDDDLKESVKRRADGTYNPITKKVRLDRIANVAKMVNDAQEADLHRRQQKVARDKEKGKENLQKLREAANAARDEQVRLDANAAGGKRKRDEEERQRELDAEFVQAELNKKRRALRRPVPPPGTEKEQDQEPMPRPASPPLLQVIDPETNQLLFVDSKTGNSFNAISRAPLSTIGNLPQPAKPATIEAAILPLVKPITEPTSRPPLTPSGRLTFQTTQLTENLLLTTQTQPLPSTKPIQTATQPPKPIETRTPAGTNVLPPKDNAVIEKLKKIERNRLHPKLPEPITRLPEETPPESNTGLSKQTPLVSHIPATQLEPVAPADVVKQSEALASILDGPLTKEEQEALYNHTDNQPPPQHVLQRFRDHKKLLKEIERVSKEHLADFAIRHRQGHPQSPLDIAYSKGHASLEAYRLHRVQEIMKKHKYANALRIDEVAFRPYPEAIEHTRAQMAQAQFQHAKFYNMLSDLRDWEAIADWQSDGRHLAKLATIDEHGLRTVEV